jgi:hypothetical protein
MKLTWMLAALAGFAVLTGCDTPTPALLSLEPVATAQDKAPDTALVGTWAPPGDDSTLCVIRQGDQGGYQIVVLAGGSPVGFEAQLFRVGDVELLDVTPSDIARIWLTFGTLRWAFLDSGWLKQQAAVLATHDADGKMLLLSPTAAVRAFIAANGANDQAYGKVATWQKVQ